MLVDRCLNMFLDVLCRARGRHDQRRTGTPCGTPGAPGANVREPVEGAPHTPSDDASAPSKTLKSAAGYCDTCMKVGKVRFSASNIVL